jgi:thiamine-monophosphate kinase
VTVQVQGYVEPGKALRRDAAKSGHAVLVSGTLGDAACALQQLLAGDEVDEAMLERLNRPQPRVVLGQGLAGVAAACIDISDGLLADLGHILQASHCGATLWPERLPASDALKELPFEQRLGWQYNGGDDYELCFTVAPECYAAMQAALQERSLNVTEIGVIDSHPGIRCQHEDGRMSAPPSRGFDHFRTDSDG